MPHPKSLKVHQLSFAYDGRWIFDGIEFEVMAGEVLVLLGANGAGKTTLLRTLAKQLPPMRGDLLLDGLSLKNLSRMQLAKRVSLMPQFELRDTALTVHEVVSLGRVPHTGWLQPWKSDDEQIVQESMQATGVWELRERTLDKLSGGEWRRMILARSLAQQSSVLLLDEPTAGLDLKYQYESLEKVRELVKERKLISIITLHDLQQAALFADRIALLSENRLIACGSPEQVLTPKLITEAFGIEVVVVPNPVNGLPLVVPVRAIREG